MKHATAHFFTVWNIWDTLLNKKLTTHAWHRIEIILCVGCVMENCVLVRSVAHSTLSYAPNSNRGDQEPSKYSKIVLQSFNTWAFKRQQPTEPEKLEQFVSSAIDRSEPLSFVLYWGKGPRSGPGESESTCLRFLNLMGQRIQAVYPPGAHFRLIATDTHAAHNGHCESSISEYFEQVASVAAEFDFSLSYLRQIVAAQEAGIVAQSELPASEIIEKLEPCAEKWFKGDGTVSDGAAQYYQMNMREKHAVELAFPESIFITFNNAGLRQLFPANLPVFYMYSLRKGCSVKPWFLDAEAAQVASMEDPHPSDSPPCRYAKVA
jgi:L-tyrosine isonitrile synthase